VYLFSVVLGIIVTMMGIRFVDLTYQL